MKHSKKRTIFISRKATSKKDFAWHAAKRNPYIMDAKGSIKHKIEFFFLFILAFITVAFLFYHPYFQIQDIEVYGLNRIDRYKFMDAVNGTLESNRFLFFYGHSYMLLNTDELEEVLTNKFALTSIEIDKSFPHSLNIHVEEQISNIVYDNGKEYSYLSQDGTLVEKLRKTGEDEWEVKTEMVTSTNEDGEAYLEEIEVSRTHHPPIINLVNEMGQYPIVYDKRNKSAEINQIMLNPETAAAILRWFNNLRKKENFTHFYFVIGNELGDAEVINLNSYNLKIRMSENVGEQLQSLDNFLHESDRIESIHYIDLRYKDRIYWQ